MASSDFPDDLFAELGVDAAAILVPLDQGEGGGVDLRYTPEADALAEARREEDTSEQGIWQKEIKRADWNEVVRLATEILATKSKDLQTAVWLAQALVRLHGLRGLAAGLELLARLGEALWPALWPRPDGDDLEPRLAPYFWIDGHLVSELLRIEVTLPIDKLGAGVTYQAVIKARKLQQISSNKPKAYEQAVADGELTMAALDQFVLTTADAFLIERHAQAKLALRALGHLQAQLDQAAGAEAPSFAALRQTVQDIERLFAQILANRGHVTAKPPEEEDVANPENEAPAPVEMSTSTGMPLITSRRAAYALLDLAADWLLANEPHSPAPYLVKRAVSWEGLPLRDLLGELMTRGADLALIYHVLGIGEDGRPAPRKPDKSAFAQR